jgi:hypothetical protein
MPKDMVRVRWLTSMASPDAERKADSEGFVDPDEAASCAAAGFCEILEKLGKPKKERAVK